jgi:Tfp pilus assembly protein PilO
MTKRDRIVVGVLAVVALLGAFGYAVLKPKQSELAVLGERIGEAEQRRESALNDLRTASSAREQYRRDQATLAVLGKAVPADDGVPSLLYQVHKAARTAGVDFDGVTVGEGATVTAAATPGAADAPAPGTVPGPEGLAKLPIKITFTGDFFKLDRFVKAMHAFAKIGDERVDVRGRLLTIDGIALKPGIGGLPKLKAEVIANAYIVGTASGAAAATPAATPAPAPAGENQGSGEQSSGGAANSTTEQTSGAGQ